MTHRKFSQEYKCEAVRLVLEQGLSVSQAAQDLGIGTSTLSKWVSIQRENSLSLGQTSESEKAELKRLRKEVIQLRMERDLLKKTAIYFATPSTKSASL